MLNLSASTSHDAWARKHMCTRKCTDEKRAWTNARARTGSHAHACMRRRSAEGSCVDIARNRP